jgi:digalactosyldiacylglycerol synthase
MSFDREIENAVTPPFAVSAMRSLPSPPAEIKLVKKLQSKLSEFSHAYSSPDFSKRVLEKWRLRANSNRFFRNQEHNSFGGETD